MATASMEREKTNPDKQPSVFCETCEYKRTTKYCKNCELSFCGTCIKVHQKMKGSQDHVVREISEPESTHEGKQLEPQLPCCFDHPGNEYKHFCTECTCLICEKCNLAHHGHSLQAIINDFSFYRNVCRKNTQRLLDTSHELEDYKSLLERNTRNCDEAIANVEKWESELIASIKECAKQLKEALIKRKEGHQQKTLVQQLNVDDMLREIDDQVANLNARNQLDQQMLAHETASSQSLLSKAVNMVQTLPPQPKEILVSKLVHRNSDLKGLISGIKHFFEVTELTKSNVAKLLGEFKIPNPKFYCNGGYKICKPSASERVIMHGSSKANLRIFDTVNRVIYEEMSNRNIWNMIALSSRKYACLHGTGDKLILLADNFQYVDTIESKCGFSFISLFPISSNRFLVYEIKEKFPPKGFLRVINVTGGQLHHERQIRANFDISRRSTTPMAMLSNHFQALICFDNMLWKVDINSGALQQYDLSLCAKSTVDAMCVTTDAYDNILVGCNCGIIHMFDRNVQMHKEYLKLKAGAKPNDIEVVGDRLFVTILNKLFEYTHV